MAQFWIAIFFILLAIAQLYQSIKDINLPFPVYLILGTVLAVAANPQHKFSFIPSQQVTLQEIKTPDPVLATAATSPLLTATDTPAVTPAELIPTIEPAQTAAALPAVETPQPDPTQLVKTKKPRTSKAATKSKPV
jgi:hypothetical protein